MRRYGRRAPSGGAKRSDGARRANDSGYASTMPDTGPRPTNPEVAQLVALLGEGGLAEVYLPGDGGRSFG